MSNYNTKPHIFFIESSQNLDKQIELSKQESMHIINSLRLETNVNIRLFDGIGNLYDANIVNISKGKCFVTVNYKIKEDIDQSFGTIIISAIKLENLEWVIEKLTELNCKNILITKTLRSQLGLEMLEIKHEKLNYVAINACKQSERLFLPRIELLTIDQIFFRFRENPNKYIPTTELVGEEINNLHLSKDSIFFIGPEGGFEQKELIEIIANGFMPIKLTHNILRSETASIFCFCKIV